MLNVRQCGCHFIYIIPLHPRNSPYGIDTIIISTSQVRGLWTRGHVTCPKSFIQPVSSRAGALGTSDSEALHLITMQYSLLYSPLSPKHPGYYYSLISATPIITTPNGELWRVILFRNLNTKFLLHRKSTRSEVFRFLSLRFPSVEQLQKDQPPHWSSTAIRKSSTGVNAKKKFCFGWDTSLIYIWFKKPFIHAFSSWYLLNVSYTLNWVLLWGKGEREQV